MKRLGLLLLIACRREPVAEPGPHVRMDFDGEGIYDAPFPSDHQMVDGRVSLAGYPNPDAIPFVDTVVAMVEEGTDGMSLTGGVFFQATEPLDPAGLPDFADSLDPSSSVGWVGLDGDDAGVRIPISVQLEDWAGPFGEHNLLEVLPMQGRPLLPGSRYVVYVTKDVHLASGEELAAAPQIGAILSGGPVAGLSASEVASWRFALLGLIDAGVSAESLVAFDLLTTGNPTADLQLVADRIRAQVSPPAEDPVLVDVWDTYCVYQATVSMPVYQGGTPPYATEGGAWTFDEDGVAILDHWEDARLILTIPRTTQPESGFPVVAMIRTGGGGDRPIVDRGVGDADHNFTPGTGPAQEFAAVGWAGAEIDGPLGGPLRNPDDADEQFLVFNVANPWALRDNVRQSAAEVAAWPKIVLPMSFSVDDCPGVSATDGLAHFDAEHMVLMGHSMGGTIAPIAQPFAPEYEAMILSGAGGSFIENIIWKESPLTVKPLAEGMLSYANYNRHLTEHDPFLSILQWGGELSDPPVYADLARRDPEKRRHSLHFQGIVDTYILPPLVQATAIPLGEDLGGAAHDVEDPDLDHFLSMEEALALNGLGRVDLPASGNAGDGAVTAIVVQHVEDGIEDGHEVMFQLEAPKAQYRTFLETLVSDGVPTVPAPQ